MECDLVEIVHETGHGPRYITHLNIKAGRNSRIERATSILS